MRATVHDDATIGVVFTHGNFKQLAAEIKETGCARWDPKTKGWTLKPSLESVQYLIDHKANISAEDDLKLRAILQHCVLEEKRKNYRRELSKAITAPVIPEIAEKITRFTPSAYQWVPVHYAIQTNARFLLADDMGCIDGEAVLQINRGGASRKIKLKDVYKRFHGQNKRYAWDRNIKTYTRSFMNGEIRLNEVVDVLDKGVRPVLEIETGTGKRLKLTHDHELLLSDNRWVRADKLQVGDVVVTNGALFHPKHDSITSIKEAGKTQVYDLVMADPHRNFVANGLVVHNCGKTIQSVMTTMHPHFADVPVLIICPPSLLTNWQAEMLDKFGLHVPIIKEFDKPIPGQKYYLIGNTRLKNVKPGPWFLICDEAHAYKGRKSERTKQLKKLSAKAKHIMLMTGTPVLNNLSELYQLLNIIDPQLMAYTTFLRVYLGWVWTPYGKQVGTGKNMGKLHNWLLETCYVRRTKEQVLDQLPPKVRQTIPISAQKVIAETVLQMYPANAAVKAKNTEFLAFVESIIECTDKLILFAHHQVMMDALEDLCKRLKIGYVRIDGKTSDKEREVNKKRFNEDPDCRVFILSLGAGGTGLNIQVANVVLFAELAWNGELLKQAEDRAHRRGQERHVFCLYPLITKFDDELFKLNLAKMSITARTTDGLFSDDQPDENVLAHLSKVFGVPTGWKGSK